MANEWMERAQCARKRRDGRAVYDAEMWQPTGTTGSSVPQIADAKAICGVCPVIEECRDYALTTPVESGILGGLTEDERKNEKRRRQRRAKSTAPPNLIPCEEAMDIVKATRLTNRQVADRTGLHEDTVSAIRRGVNEWVSPETMKRLKDAFEAVKA